jgi:hypothetical protein
MPAGLMWLRWANTLLDASVTSLSLSHMKMGLCPSPEKAILSDAVLCLQRQLAIAAVVDFGAAQRARTLCYSDFTVFVANNGRSSAAFAVPCHQLLHQFNSQ